MKTHTEALAKLLQAVRGDKSLASPESNVHLDAGVRHLEEAAARFADHATILERSPAKPAARSAGVTAGTPNSN